MCGGLEFGVDFLADFANAVVEGLGGVGERIGGGGKAIEVVVGEGSGEAEGVGDGELVTSGVVGDCGFVAFGIG